MDRTSSNKGQSCWQDITPSLQANILDAIKSLDFQSMTPVQSATIPVFMSYKDVVVEAVTGSGKTLAFIVPALQMLCKREENLQKYDVGAIILTPTRELAIQIHSVLETFLRYVHKLSQVLFIGGVDLSIDVKKWREHGANIIVATPGRLEDIINRRQDDFNLAYHVKTLEVLILDEADRLLDLGFEESLNTIIKYLPKQRRTGLFSATQTDKLEELVRTGLRNPIRITVREKNVSKRIEQKVPSSLHNYYLICPFEAKFSRLVYFLKKRKELKHMIFFSTCACVEYFSKALISLLPKVRILRIHGKMKKRKLTFELFRTISSGILICTDVMARGVDIPKVHWVIQYDVPTKANAFIHRCGRTARIGNEGNALVLLNPNEEPYVEFLSLNQKVPLTEFICRQNIKDCTPNLRALAMNDRDMYIKGIRAFVSFISSYRKHECSYIFRLKELDLCLLARAFGLLHMPKMPELRGCDISQFEDVNVDVDTIAYKDKTRERHRQELLQKQADEKEVKNMNHHKKKKLLKNEPWSRKKQREVKKEKKRQNKQLVKKRNIEEKYDEMMQEFGELSKEINLMKKLKRKKISQEEFDAKIQDEVTIA